MVGFGIINPALSESANATILENDTANEVDQEKQSDFGELKRLAGSEGRTALASGSEGASGTG